MNILQETRGKLSADEDAMRNTDADRLAWMDAHRVYIEIGDAHTRGSSYIVFNRDEGAWEARVHNGAYYKRIDGDNFPTLRDALQAVIDE